MKEQAARGYMAKADSHKPVAEVCEESEEIMIRLSIALVDCIQTKKLTSLLMTEAVNSADAVVKQVGYDEVNWLRQGLEMAVFDSTRAVHGGRDLCFRGCSKKHSLESWRERGEKRIGTVRRSGY